MPSEVITIRIRVRVGVRVLVLSGYGQEHRGLVCRVNFDECHWQWVWNQRLGIVSRFCQLLERTQNHTHWGWDGWYRVSGSPAIELGLGLGLWQYLLCF